MTDTDMLYVASLQKRNEELEACVAELEGLNDRLVKENEKLEKHIEIVQTDKEVDDIQIAHYDDDLKRKTGLRAVAEIERLRAENKKAKELLKAAVEDIQQLNILTVDGEGGCLIEKQVEMETCLECPLNTGNAHICGWRHRVEALALIGEDINVPASATDANIGGKEDGDING